MRPLDPLAAGSAGLPPSLEAPELDRLIDFYREGSRDGGFEAGIELALRFVLASPQFIFRLEAEPAAVEAGAVYPLADLDLASRLSFFLWSSIPTRNCWRRPSAGA